MAKQKGSKLNDGEIGSELPESTQEEQVRTEENHEQQQPEAEEKTAPKKFKKDVVVSGASFWEFDVSKVDADGPKFIGKFLNNVVREKDGPKAASDENQRAGAVMGFTFEQFDTGARFIIGNSHAIKKALEKDQYSKETLWEIEYLGKGAKSDGQQYNRFECSRLIEE